MSGARIPSIGPLVEVGRRGAGRVSRTLRAPCTLHIGSSSACDLRVVARGVRARHLALEWDGVTLTMLAEPGTGPVHCEGRTLRLPSVLSGGSTKLEIGDAEVRVSVPEEPEDEPTLIMDRDRTEVPPPRSDDPTDISERPLLPIDATTTQRVRHHRSRLDVVCRPLERAEGRGRRVAEATRGWLSRSRASLAVGVASAAIATGVALFLHKAPPHPGAIASSSAQTLPPPSISSAVPRAPVLTARAGAGEGATTTTVTMSPAAAARLLASGRRHEAGDAYRALSKAHPEEPVFGALTKILAREERAGETARATPEGSP